MTLNNLVAGMGEINRGGLPDLDRKSRSGFFFHPDLDRNRDRDFFFVPKSRDKSRDKSRPNLDSPRLLVKSRGESRLASTFLELPRKF